MPLMFISSLPYMVELEPCIYIWTDFGMMFNSTCCSGYMGFATHG